MDVTPEPSDSLKAQRMPDAADRGRWARLRAPILADPARREHYERKKAAVVATRRWLQFIDEVRQELGISKAELARRVGMEPSAVRRLFSSAQSNPTLETVVTMMVALDIRWDLQRRPPDGAVGTEATAA